MEENLQIHEKFDAYLREEMNDDEKAQMEKELQDNPQVKEEFRLYRIMVEGIKEAGKDQFKAQLKGIDEGMANVSLPYRFSRKIALAASILVLLGVGTLLLLINKTAQPELYAQYFKPWENDYPFNTRGEIPEQFSEFTTDEYEEFKAAAHYYDNEEYTEAINVLKSLEQQHQDNEDIKYLLGLSYLNNDEAEESIPYLEDLNNNLDFAYKYEVKWYYGLALIYIGNDEEAKRIMNELAYSASSFSGKARQIVEKLTQVD